MSRPQVIPRGAGRFLATAAALFTAGCAAMGTVRSAQVTPGLSANVQASITTKPGDAAGWFFSLDCASRCDHPIGGGDLTVGWGLVNEDGPSFTVGGGINGLFPYAEGYAQLGGGDRPFGVGGRLGLPFGSWNQHQLYGRLDLPLGAASRVLFNPGLLLHTGNSPNGQNSGSMVAVFQGVGLSLGTGAVTVVPSVTAVLARSERTSYGEQIGPETRAFLTASIGVAIHRPRR